MITVRWILEKLDYESRQWPMIFRSTGDRHDKEDASIPEALYSAVEHIDEAEKIFAKLADEYIPRGREDDVTKIVRRLTEAKREVRVSRYAIEALDSIFRPWRQEKKD